MESSDVPEIDETPASSDETPLGDSNASAEETPLGSSDENMESDVTGWHFRYKFVNSRSISFFPKI